MLKRLKKGIQSFFIQLKETFEHFGWFTLLIIPIFVLINWSFLAVVSSQRESITVQQRSIANQEIQMIDFYVSRQLESTHDDLHVIKDSNETLAYLDSRTEEDFEEFEALAYRIATNKPQFLNLSFLNLDGDELFRVSRDGDTLIKVDETDLDDYASEEFMTYLEPIQEDFLYVNDLYIKDEKPLLRFVTPLFYNDIKQGYLLVDYDANQFLSVFQLYADSDEDEYMEFGLINQGDVWKIDADSLSLYEVNQTSENQSILNLIENDPYTLSIHVDLDQALTPNINVDEGFLVIYVSIDMDAVIGDSQSYALRYPWLLVFINIAFISVYLYMGYILKTKNDDRILLNANMYLSDHNKDGVLITDEDYHIQYVNQAFETFFGYPIDDIKGKTPKDVIGQIDITGADFDKEFQNHVWNVTKDGIHILKFLRIRKENNSHGQIKHYIAIYSEPHIDIKYYYDYVQEERYHLDILQFGLREKPFKKDQSFIMMIRIDISFDEVFSKYLKTHLDDSIILALPKPYLVILYGEAKDRKAFLKMVDRVDNIIEQFRRSETHDRFYHLFVSAYARDGIDNIRQLIRAGFIAIESSKSSPQTKHHIYKEEMIAQVEREKQIKDVLDQGFNNEEFYLQYQLIKDIEDDRYISAEALLRWKNEDIGFIPPNEFIPIIENSFYINQLTTMVVKKVIEDFSPYIDQLDPDFKISVNFTEFDFRNDYIIHQIVDLIEQSPLSTKLFTFEITESNYLDNLAQANDSLAFLREKEIALAIDDFGTGYSSMKALESLKVDYVKIDKSFLDCFPSKVECNIFKSIVELVKNLNKPMIIEGVETKEQVAFCKKLQCRYLQGYYYTKPVLIEQMIHDLTASKEGD